jgi:hypothetical protein
MVVNLSLCVNSTPCICVGFMDVKSHALHTSTLDEAGW